MHAAPTRPKDGHASHRTIFSDIPTMPRTMSQLMPGMPTICGNTISILSTPIFCVIVHCPSWPLARNSGSNVWSRPTMVAGLLRRNGRPSTDPKPKPKTVQHMPSRSYTAFSVQPPMPLISLEPKHRNRPDCATRQFQNSVILTPDWIQSFIPAHGVKRSMV